VYRPFVNFFQGILKHPLNGPGSAAGLPLPSAKVRSVIGYYKPDIPSPGPIAGGRQGMGRIIHRFR
jgi:hypothetical protein